MPDDAIHDGDYVIACPHDTPPPRIRACGCPVGEPHDEDRHQRNAELAANALGWALHEAEVDRYA